jgi:hypothetical protein
VRGIARPLELDRRARLGREGGREPVESGHGGHGVIVGAMDPEPEERQLNLHLDPEHLAGVYANFANVGFSDYEFTITFARIEHEVDEGDVPGAVVARVNMSERFMRELMDAMADAWSKWSHREGIRNLPETPGD